jgi:hypothetical protein
VADGHVYVATYQELAIFGLGTPAAGVNENVFAAQARKATAPAGFELPADEHAIWGTISAVSGDAMVIKTRSGALVRVDLTAARQAGNVAAPVVGEAGVVLGRFVAGGVLDASNVEHAKSEPALWPRDQ